MLRPKLPLAAVALALAARAAPAFEGIDVENWKPALDPYGYVTVDGARALRSLAPHAALYVNWAHEPLRLEVARPGGFGKDVVRDLTVFDAVLALGLFDLGDHGGLEIGVDLPYAVDVNGISIALDPATGKPDDLRQASLGNLRTAAKLALLDPEEDVVGIALRGEVQWPTGRDEDFLSNDRHAAWDAGLVVEEKIGPVRFGVEALYEGIHGAIQVEGATIDDKLKLGAGLAVRPFESLPLEVVAEVFHWTRAGHPWRIAAESPVEVGGAVKLAGTVFALLGASTGLDTGVGAAEARLYAAIGATF
jgi:hypothetical protein